MVASGYLAAVLGLQDSLPGNQAISNSVSIQVRVTKLRTPLSRAPKRSPAFSAASRPVAPLYVATRSVVEPVCGNEARMFSTRNSHVKRSAMPVTACNACDCLYCETVEGWDHT